MPVVIHIILLLRQCDGEEVNVISLFFQTNLEVVGTECRGTFFQMERQILTPNLVEADGFVVSFPFVHVGGAVLVWFYKTARKIFDQPLVYAEIDVPEDVRVVYIVHELYV
jgi:hypothetical protein